MVGRFGLNDATLLVVEEKRDAIRKMARGMKVILFGATGMVGQGVLRAYSDEGGQ